MRLVVGMVVLAVLYAWTPPAFADEHSLQWDNGVAGSMTYKEDRAHIVYFTAPDDWEDTLCSAVRFYGRRFGDVTGIYGTVVIYAPQEGMASFRGAPNDCWLQVLARNQFPLQDVPEEAGWVDVKVDPVKVVGEFAVVVYTYTTADHGVEIGVSDTTGEESHSGNFYMTKIRKKNEGGPDTVETTDHMEWFNDQREWMIRALISPTVAPPEKVSAEELAGPQVIAYDDGEAEGFYTSQRYGPMVRFQAASGSKVNRVYVMARLAGNWFGSDRQASVYLMDKDMRILQRKTLAYKEFATEPAWSYVDFDSIPVTEEFYVLIEPVSRPDVEMDVGADTSGENQGSLWGTAGTILAWDCEAPEESTNWMIRVRME